MGNCLCSCISKGDLKSPTFNAEKHFTFEDVAQAKLPQDRNLDLSTEHVPSETAKPQLIGLAAREGGTYRLFTPKFGALGGEDLGARDSLSQESEEMWLLKAEGSAESQGEGQGQTLDLARELADCFRRVRGGGEEQVVAMEIDMKRPIIKHRTQGLRKEGFYFN